MKFKHISKGITPLAASKWDTFWVYFLYLSSFFLLWPGTILEFIAKWKKKKNLNKHSQTNKLKSLLRSPPIVNVKNYQHSIHTAIIIIDYFKSIRLKLKNLIAFFNCIQIILTELCHFTFVVLCASLIFLSTINEFRSNLGKLCKVCFSCYFSLSISIRSLHFHLRQNDFNSNEFESNVKFSFDKCKNCVITTIMGK